MIYCCVGSCGVVSCIMVSLSCVVLLVLRES